MVVTKENFVEQYEKHKSNLPADFYEFGDYAVANIDIYDLDEDIASQIDNTIAAFNAILAKQQPAAQKKQPKFKKGDYVIYTPKNQECYVEDVNGDGTYNLATVKTVIAMHMMNVNESDLVLKSGYDTPVAQPKKNEPKFKIGDKVITDHSSTEVYEIVDIENGKYKLNRTSGWWSESQLTKAPKKQPKPVTTNKVEPKLMVDDWVKFTDKRSKYYGKKGKITELDFMFNPNHPYCVAIDGNTRDVVWCELNELKQIKAPKIKPKKAKYKVGDIVIVNYAQDYEHPLHQYIAKVTDVITSTDEISYSVNIAAFGVEVMANESEIISKGLKRNYTNEFNKHHKAEVYQNASKVGDLCAELKIIKRYCNLNNKKFSGKCKAIARGILTALQQFIVTKQIRKTSEYAADIVKIQDVLLKLMKQKVDDSIKIEIDEYDRLVSLVEGYAVGNDIIALKKYIAVVGKQPDGGDLQKILNALNAAKSEGQHVDRIDEAIKSLEAYKAKRTEVVEASQQMLEGIYGLCGITAPGFSQRMHKASAAELANTYFDCLHLKGKWEKIIGKPNRPFKLMIYGKPGSGKSTLALQFAGALAARYGQKVLYVAAEEGLSYTMKEKLERLDIKSPNLTIVDEMPKDVAQYATIFIDSVNHSGYSAEELRKLPGGHNYVYVMQTTKDGNFRGSQEYLHDVDTCVKVEEMHAHTEKNRFGAMGDAMVLDGDDEGGEAMFKWTSYDINGDVEDRGEETSAFNMAAAAEYAGFEIDESDLLSIQPGRKKVFWGEADMYDFYSDWESHEQPKLIVERV